jgi:phage terminase large subunit
MTSAHISIIPEFKEKIELMGLEAHFEITKSEIVNKTSGSEIIFRGIKTSSGDQTANLKSLQGITTWIVDEAEELIEENTFDKINLSIRSSKQDNRVVLILNPSTKEHWIYRRFFEDRGVQPGTNGEHGDTCYVHTTYQDNIDNLPQSFLDEVNIMRERRPDKYKHSILGGWLDKAEGVIFSNWSIGLFQNMGSVVFGQDYGFSQDPTTLVETSIDRANKKIYLRLHLYEKGLTTSMIADINKSKAGVNLIIGDSAEPRLITELNAMGCNVVPAIKGPDSVSYGISLMQDYDLIIDEGSIELIKELNNYCWLSQKSKTPIDKWNHALDAIRYAISYQLENPNKGKYYII